MRSCFLYVGLLIISIAIASNAIAFDGGDTSTHSKKKQALQYLDQHKIIEQSKYWINVKPAAFIENLRLNVDNPMTIYGGRATNFCGYAAISYIPLTDDPLGFVQFMLRLYKDGKATMGSVALEPSLAVQQATGTLRYKGRLDARPAEQMWFMTLADHFKGYLNFFNRKYQPGDENKFWAASNYAKFNRMVRKLFNYKVDAVGYDILRPGVKNIVQYLRNRIDTGTMFLYLNNTFLVKKDHGPKKRLPTHFVVLLNISEENENGLVTIIYWDNGFRTLQQVSPAFLKKIIFGITHCTPKIAHAL